MTALFRVILAVGVALYIAIIFYLMRKGRMSLKYSLLWLLTGVILLLLAIFPGIVNSIARLMGIHSDVNALFFIGIVFLILIILSLTSIVSRQSEFIRNLTSSQAILEKRIRKLEEESSRKKERHDR